MHPKRAAPFCPFQALPLTPLSPSEALHKKSNEAVPRSGIRTGSNSDRVSVGKKAVISLSTIAFVDEQGLGRYHHPKRAAAFPGSLPVLI